MTTSTGEHSARRRNAWLGEALLVVGVLGALVVYITPTLGDRLLEVHAFRQTQTAYTARVFHEQGIDLLHPQLPVFGEPFEVPFEFPLFQAVASIAMDLGVSDDAAARLTGFVCFLGTALLLYGLVRHVAGRATALASMAAFALSPFALLWARTSMIEYLATAGAVGWAWSLIAWRESRRPLPGALALVAGLVGMLVKPTTAIFWIAPALLYRPTITPNRPDRRLRSHAWTAAIVVLPIVAAAAWTRHADAIKAASRTTEWLTSWELRDWNFGTLDQRLDRDVWETIFDRIRHTVVGLTWVFLPVAIVAAARSRQRLFWLGIASAALLPPLVFTNLYFVHDYYLAAVTPAIAALIGLGAGYLWTLLPRRRVVTVTASVIALLFAVGLGRGNWLGIDERSENPELLPMATEIETRTNPDDLIAVIGLDWSPAVLYYAHRRGHMVVPDNEQFAYDLIHDQGYRYLLAANPGDQDLRFLSRWRWVGALGSHTFAIADSPRHLSEAQFSVTDDRRVVSQKFASGQRLVERGFRMPCGRLVRVPAGARGTWIMLEKPDPNARITASEISCRSLRAMRSLSLQNWPRTGDSLSRAVGLSP